MGSLTPTGDVTVGGWINDQAGTTLYDHLAPGSGHYVESQLRMVNGPVRVLFIVSDDGARWPMDFGATMTAGPRSGENPRAQTISRIINKATNFTNGRTDHSPCSPGRAAFSSGLWANNHFNTAVIVQQYYDYCRNGKQDNHCYDGTNRWPGPIEHDCALLAATAFFADVNQSASAWSSGTTYHTGDQVSRVVNSWDYGTVYHVGDTVTDGADGHSYTAKNTTTANNAPHSTSADWTDNGAAAPRFFIAQATTSAGHPPEVRCDPLNYEWRDYGTLNAANLLLAQQSCPAAEQPFGGLTSGARARLTGRGDGCPEVWQIGTTYKTTELVRYGAHQFKSKNNTNTGHIPTVGGDSFWTDTTLVPTGSYQGVWCDDLQLTGGIGTWLSQTGRVKCYEFEKTQNGVGQLGNSPNNVSDPATATVGYWISGHSYTTTAPDKVAYLGNFYTCISNVSGSTTPDADATHWSLVGPAYTDRYVSPGWLRKVISADDLQDHYRNAHIDFDTATAGANPASGNGQIGNNSSLQYDWEIASLTYNSGTNLVTVVTSSAMTGDPALVPGQTYDISIDAWAANPINAGGATNWVEPEVVATCVNSTTFTFTPTHTPTGSPVLTHAFCYVRQWFETYWYGVKHAAILADVSLNDNLFVYHGTHMPHASISHAGRSSGDIQAERRYANTLYGATPNSQAWNWANGGSGTWGPDVGSGSGEAGSNAHRQTWADRLNMFASQDDSLGAILDAWDAKFGADTYYVIMVDDNGFQYGGHHIGNGKGNATEDDSWVEPGGKTFLWENSVRISFFIRGPGFQEGATDTSLVELADIPMTILKMFEGAVPELVDHHAHTKRDGMAIQDKLAKVLPTKHQFCKGKYMQGAGGSGVGGNVSDHPKVIDKDGNAYIKLWTGNLADADTYNQLFLGAGTDSGTPDESEYETVNHLSDNAGTIAQGAALSAILLQLMTGRWEPSQGAHTGRV